MHNWRSSYSMGSCSRLRHRALCTHRANIFVMPWDFLLKFWLVVRFFSPFCHQHGRMGTEGEHGPVTAHELWSSEVPDVYCGKRRRHVHSTCDLLPAYLVGPVKQRIRLSQDNLHILSQPLSSVSLGRNVCCLHCAMGRTGSGEPFQLCPYWKIKQSLELQFLRTDPF